MRWNKKELAWATDDGGSDIKKKSLKIIKMEPRFSYMKEKFKTKIVTVNNILDKKDY